MSEGIPFPNPHSNPECQTCRWYLSYEELFSGMQILPMNHDGVCHIYPTGIERMKTSFCRFHEEAK